MNMSLQKVAYLALNFFLVSLIGASQANDYSSPEVKQFADIFSPPISEAMVKQFFDYGVRTSKDVEDTFNRGSESGFFDGMPDITEIELLKFLKFENEQKAIAAKQDEDQKEKEAFNLGICAGAIEVSNMMDGESDYNRNVKNKILPQMQYHAKVIKAACPERLNATCFESMPLETRTYFNAFGMAQKELVRPQPTSFMQKHLIGNDPMTIGIVLTAHCPSLM